MIMQAIQCLYIAGGLKNRVEPATLSGQGVVDSTPLSSWTEPKLPVQINSAQHCLNNIDFAQP